MEHWYGATFTRDLERCQSANEFNSQQNKKGKGTRDWGRGEEKRELILYGIFVFLFSSFFLAWYLSARFSCSPSTDIGHIVGHGPWWQTGLRLHFPEPWLTCQLEALCKRRSSYNRFIRWGKSRGISLWRMLLGRREHVCRWTLNHPAERKLRK